MASILDAHSCVELTRAIVGGFVGLADFGMFVGDRLNENFVAQIPANQDFETQVHTFVIAKNVQGQIGDLLDHLADHWQENRDDLLPVMRRLLDSIDGSRAGPSWFLSHASLEKDQAEAFVDHQVFEVFKGILQRPFAGNKDIRISEVLGEEINQSQCFVALLGRYYVKSKISTEIFDYAFNAWQNRLSGEPTTRQKLIVLLLDDVGNNWWNNNYSKKLPSDSRGFWVRRVDKDLAALKAELERWLTDPKPGPVSTNCVVVLGEPIGSAPAQISVAIDNLVSSASDRAPDFIEYWRDGWSSRSPLPATERARILAKAPVFVRTIFDRAATIREAQADLKPHLLNAFGFHFFDEASWLATLAKFQRIYWRPDGPEWTGGGTELGWTGQPQDIGARLAELAGLAVTAGRQMIVRYEDPKSEDPAQTRRNRQLVVNSLQSAAQHGAGGDIVQSTVPISFEKIEDSIKKFTKNGLNVIALHDLDARPRDLSDTIRRFEGADRRIDNAVNSMFGNIDQTPILRVAVLLRNASLFDGLKFDQGSSVRRWNLLKRSSASDGTQMFDPQDCDNISQEARDLLAGVSGQLS